MTDDIVRKEARMLRLVIVRGCLVSGDISRKDAIDLLKGPLTPGDDSTIVDDSELLDLNNLACVAVIFGTDEGDKNAI